MPGSSPQSKRLRTFYRYCLIILIPCFTPLDSRAALEDLPGDTMIGVELGDTAAFWSKAQKLPITQACLDFLKGPALSNNLDYQQFNLGLKKAEEIIGFPLTADELLTRVFSRGTFAITYLPIGAQSPPEFILDIKVRDHDKAVKLVSAISDAAIEAVATDSSTSATTRKEKIGEYDITWCDNAVSTIGYGLTKDRLLISNAPQDLKSFLEPEANSGKLGDSNALKKLVKAMPGGKGDIHGYFDAKQLMGQSGLPMMFGGLGSSDGQTGSQVYFSSNILGDGIGTRSVSTRNPDEIMTGSTAKGLQSIRYIGEKPLIALAFGLFNGQSALNALEQMGPMMQMMMGTPPAGSGNIFGGFEIATGVSVKEDLLPAIGQELTISVNSFQMNPMNPIPMIDLTAMVEVADESRLQSLLSKLENYLEETMSGMGPQGEAPPKFQSLNSGETVIRTLNSGSPMLTPSYAVNEGTLLLSLNTSSIESAIGRSMGKTPSFDSSPLFAEVKAGLVEGSTPYSFNAISVDKLVQDLVMTFLPMFAAGVPQLAENQLAIFSFCNKILMHIGTSAQLDAKTPDGMTSGYNKLQIK
jgi:hypothetical protein